jgi:hypothetical protein
LLVILRLVATGFLCKLLLVLSSIAGPEVCCPASTAAVLQALLLSCKHCCCPASTAAVPAQCLWQFDHHMQLHSASF